MPVSNRFFRTDELGVLLHPETWRLVAPPSVAELGPCEAPGHQAWMRGNTHAHAHQEVCLILAGSGLHGCGGAVYPLEPGTVLHLGPFVDHDQAPPPDMDQVDQLWFSLVREAAIARVVEVRQGQYSFRRGFCELLSGPEVHVGECLRGVTEAAAAEPEGLAALGARGAVMTLVAALVSRGQAGHEVERAQDFQGEVVTAICRHLQETAGCGESLESLARLAGYSKFHFLRLFKAHTGQSVHEYIDQCRLQRVRRLRATGYTERAIGEALGFSSPAVYCRWYRRQEGR